MEIKSAKPLMNEGGAQLLVSKVWSTHATSNWHPESAVVGNVLVQPMTHQFMELGLLDQIDKAKIQQLDMAWWRPCL